MFSNKRIPGIVHDKRIPGIVHGCCVPAHADSTVRRSKCSNGIIGLCQGLPSCSKKNGVRVSGRAVERSGKHKMLEQTEKGHHLSVMSVGKLWGTLGLTELQGQRGGIILLAFRV